MEEEEEETDDIPEICWTQGFVTNTIVMCYVSNNNLRFTRYVQCNSTRFNVQCNNLILLVDVNACCIPRCTRINKSNIVIMKCR
mmetsp:Transcript_4483/g.7208  ORF Transcript_4483/g.7208 Transcript_4483/m.7208 type:complete len:84 (+) Transcript_4483:3-254(+)